MLRQTSVAHRRPAAGSRWAFPCIAYCVSRKQALLNTQHATRDTSERDMSLLVVNNLDKSFGGDTILANVGFRLAWRQKLGLVGRNGSGKTTLLRLLTGQQ